MGFSGYQIVGRSDQPLSDDPLDDRVLGGGWRQTAVDGVSGAPGPVASSVSAATGAPALAALILDSDCAIVSWVAPGGASGEAYLHAETAEDYGAPAAEYDADEAAPLLVAWARQAGLVCEVDQVRAALEGQETFVEDTFGGLVSALGLR